MNDTNKREHSKPVQNGRGAKMDRLATMRARKASLMAQTASIALLSACAVFASAEAKEYKTWLDIPAQSLEAALKEFGVETDSQVMFAKDVVAGRTSVQVKGVLTPREALVLLMRDTGLRIEQSAESVFLIKPASAAAITVPQTMAQAPASQPSDTANDQQKGASDKAADGDRKIERVVVTGTHIRGKYPKSSPLDIYTKEDIERTGATTTEQFVGKLPQNLGTRSQNATDSTAVSNPQSVNGVDLRGLGVGTTLVLLNGRRLALASFGQTTDVSMIPLSAVERVEVLTDGASAIYGSDAIGGVVNFILRDDFDGAETSVRYSGVTEGGLHQGNFTQTFGREWGTGNALVSYDLFSASSLAYADRDYAIAAGDGTLTPVDQRHSLLATATQHLGEQTSISGDFVFSARDVKSNSTSEINPNPIFNFTQSYASDTEQVFGNLAIAHDVTSSLTASLLATYSAIDVDSSFRTVRPATGAITAGVLDTNYSGLDLTASIDGTLFALPAGDARFSLGAGYLSEEYSGRLRVSGFSSRDLIRTTTYMFGELLVPLVSADQNIPGVHNLELSLAARYTKYEDGSEPPVGNEFGDGLSPKVGLLWGLTPTLNVRGTYGESFRAPSLTELDPVAAINLLRGPGSTSSNVGGVPSTTLFVSGPSPDLDPETAETVTVGFDYRPPVDFDLRLSATFFDIDYSGRIARGDSTGGAAPRANPTLFPDVIFQPSSVEQVVELLTTTTNIVNTAGVNLSDPQAAAQILFANPNFWIIDNRLRNLALTTLDGVDLSIVSEFDFSWATLRFGGNFTKIFDYQEQISPSAPIQTVVDTVLRPVDLRGRAYVGFGIDDFNTTVSVNYVDDYSNPFAVGGTKRVASWTTIDWAATYEVGPHAREIFSGLRLSLSCQNIFDQDPPSVASSGFGGVALQLPLGYDPANANPYGRFVSLQIAKTW